MKSPLCTPDFSLSISGTPLHQIFHIPILPLLDHSHQHKNVLPFFPFLLSVTTHFSISLCIKTPERKLLLPGSISPSFSLTHSNQAFILFISVALILPRSPVTLHC
ncbi:hypothetical protein MJT46_003840 [Ovis ammon polii x Ovis aries]|nr:hypothetical protein MJT46_003840 [Ovis ammon polii x Ovis aries]